MDDLFSEEIKMYIASASTVVHFHEFPSNSLIYQYQPRSKIEGSCRSLSWSKDGGWLAVVPHSGFAEVVSLKGGCKLIHTIEDVSEPSCASFQNLSKRNLAVGTKHGQVLLYDIKSKSVRTRYPRTSSAITRVGFTAKDTHCYAGCANGELLLFNNVAKNLACTFKVPKSNSLTDVKAHVFKRNFLIGGSNEGIIAVWDTNVNKVKFSSEAHNAPVSATIFSPINTSLIVSAGLDRQVCIFDIDTRQRITKIPVENNILSLDFLDDSMYMVMGSQNGKLHIYDTRNLPLPVCSFDAHQSAIKQVCYQRTADEVFLSNNSSLGSLVSEEASRPARSAEEAQPTKKRTSDIFGMMIQGPSSVNDSYDGMKPTVSSMEGGDSFLQALGLDRNNTVESMKDETDNGDNGNKPFVDNKHLSLGGYTPNPPRTIHEKLGLYDSRNVKQTASTPKMTSQNFLPSVSPIVSSSLNQNKSTAGLSVPETHNAIKEIIHGEIKKGLDDLESKISYQLTHNSHQMRRMVLDLHMAILKEFIKVENSCNTIREEISSEPATSRESYLLEENMNLRRKVQELESRISSLTTQTVSEDNGNN